MLIKERLKETELLVTLWSYTCNKRNFINGYKIYFSKIVSIDILQKKPPYYQTSYLERWLSEFQNDYSFPTQIPFLLRKTTKTYFKNNQENLEQVSGMRVSLSQWMGQDLVKIKLFKNKT